jgi:hypothetical protein
MPSGTAGNSPYFGNERFDDEFDWHADQKRGALARMVDKSGNLLASVAAEIDTGGL